MFRHQHVRSRVLRDRVYSKSISNEIWCREGELNSRPHHYQL